MRFAPASRNGLSFVDQDMREAAVDITDFDCEDNRFAEKRVGVRDTGLLEELT